MSNQMENRRIAKPKSRLKKSISTKTSSNDCTTTSPLAGFSFSRISRQKSFSYDPKVNANIGPVFMNIEPTVMTPTDNKTIRVTAPKPIVLRYPQLSQNNRPPSFSKPSSCESISTTNKSKFMPTNNIYMFALGTSFKAKITSAPLFSIESNLNSKYQDNELTTTGLAPIEFNQIKNNKDNKDTTALNLCPIERKNRSTVETTLQTNATDPSQVTYSTRFWELSDEGRNELALLANIISEQSYKQEKVAIELTSFFTPNLKEIYIKCLSLEKDIIILRDQLEIHNKEVKKLIGKNKKQRLNAISANYVQQMDTNGWRMKEAQENWEYYVGIINDIESRTKHYAHLLCYVGDAVEGYQRDIRFKSSSIGSSINNQSQMYLQLAGRMANMHHDVERILKKHKSC